jgi:hypothetical protein
LLHRKGIALEAKTCAMGVRVEHPQELIDNIQYHTSNGRGEYLPAASYSFTTISSGPDMAGTIKPPGHMQNSIWFSPSLKDKIQR